MDKGIKGSGQGFDAASKGRLGSHSFIPQHNPPQGRLRDVMLQVWVCATLWHFWRRRNTNLARDGSLFMLARPVITTCLLQAGLCALQAAEARAKRQAVMSGGPRKLGGDATALRGLTPGQVQQLVWLRLSSLR